MRPLLLAVLLVLSGCVVERCEWTPGSYPTEAPALVETDAGDAEASSTPAESPPIE